MTKPTPEKIAAMQEAFAAFCTTVATLRDPKDGCPWDLQQTHATLRRYMIEEAYEAAEVMEEGDPKDLCAELGDVLLQVVLNAQVAKDHGEFDIVDVIRGIDSKMLRRHPHVFGTAAERQGYSGITGGQVHGNWERIKAQEKPAAGDEPKSLMADARKTQPSTAQAAKIGKLAAKIKFDWSDVGTVFGQVQSEMAEVAAELAAPQLAKDKVSEEIGDLYFSLAQLCRHLGLSPELVAADGNRKFLRRFAALEALAVAQGLDVQQASQDQLEALWVSVKTAEKSV